MDKRTKDKIDSYNISGNAFKLRTRPKGDGYTLFYELYRKNESRRRKSFGRYIKGTSGSYSEDLKEINDCITDLMEMNRKYHISKSSTFLEKKKTRNYGDANFFKVFEGYYKKKFKNKTTQKPFQNTLTYLRKYSGKSEPKLEGIDMKFCNGFRNFLDRADLENSSKRTYLQKFKQVINFLLEEKYIKENPIPRKFSFSSNIPDRTYLTENELILLMEQPAPPYSYIVTKAFIFSCFTGLRWGDLSELKFQDIKNGTLKIRQGKTKEYVEFDLPVQAVEIMEEMKQKKDSTDLVFNKLGSDYRGNKKIKKWVKLAGIEKTVTWHVARHTFACLLLLKKNDIYHVSKLLGHTDIKHTQKYLHVLKEHKSKASETLSSIGRAHGN